MFVYRKKGLCDMVSIKEYAESKNVSYEAVRRQVKRYSKELNNHVQKVGRTQYLDDVAVSFLDERRQTNPVVVFEKNKDEEIERLKEENRKLLLKVTELQEQLLEEKNKITLLQEEKIELLELKEAADKQDQEPQPLAGSGWWQRLKRLF